MHALEHLQDLYSLTALLTERENRRLVTLSRVFAEHAVVQKASQIVKTVLSERISLGSLDVAPDDLQTFMEVMTETFR